MFLFSDNSTSADVPVNHCEWLPAVVPFVSNSDRSLTAPPSVAELVLRVLKIYSYSAVVLSEILAVCHLHRVTKLRWVARCPHLRRAVIILLMRI